MPKATQHYGDLSGENVSWCTLTALLGHGKKKPRTQNLRFRRTILLPQLWASPEAQLGGNAYLVNGNMISIDTARRQNTTKEVKPQ